MAFIVRSDGKIYGTYNSCYESIRVAESLRHKGHQVERVATGQDQTANVTVLTKDMVNHKDRKMVKDWLKKMDRFDIKNYKGEE